MGCWLLILTFLAAGSHAQDEGECPAGGACSTEVKGRQPRVHYWPSARGHVGSYSTTQVVMPANLSSAFSWKFFDLGEQYNTIALGCVIDDEKNIYMSGHDAITKLDQDGKVVWSHTKPDRTIPTVPFLLDNALFGSSSTGDVFALDLGTGRELWSHRVAQEIAGDTAFLTGHEGTIIAAIDSTGGERNAKVVALNAADGEKLWDYTPAAAVWNFMGLFPLDGTLVFQDLEGRAYRVSLADGSLIWRTTGNPGTWTDGTLMLGPNNMVYAVTTHGPLFQCGEMLTKKTRVCSGAVLAYRLSDGEEVWRRNFSMPANAFVAVGHVAGLPGLTVIAPIGQQAGLPRGVYASLLLPLCMAVGSLGLSACCGLGTSCYWRCRKKKLVFKWGCLGFLLGLLLGGLVVACCLAQKPTYAGMIAALDAETGQERWTYQLPLWSEFHTAGDPEGFERRRSRGTRPLCIPNPFSAPTITGDGAVHVGYQDGQIFSIRDANGDGKIDSDSEVSTFTTGTAFSSPGTAYAPGMLAVANCDGLFVFKT